MMGFFSAGWLALAGLGGALAQAQEPPTTPQGPADIVLPQGLSAEESAALQAADRAQFTAFLADAEVVVSGQVLSTRPDPSQPQAQVVSLLIEEVFRGAVPPGVLEVAVPLVPAGLGDQARPTVVEGYRLLVMLDAGGALIGDAALYLVQAEHLWRNRRDDVFLRPGADREWTEQIDPLVDYTVSPLAEARALVQAGDSGAADAPRQRQGCRRRRGR